MVVARDITEQKRLQAENVARLSAESANKSKSSFLAGMSHELRTPLNSIIGFSEVLADGLHGGLNEKQKKYVENILGSGRHLLHLINEILDLSKVEAGKLTLELGEFPLADALEAVLCLVKEKAMNHAIRLSLEIEPGAGAVLEADETKFKQIMLNLLSNALKFTPDGGNVAVRARKAGGAAPGAELLEISVADTGIGIKPEDMPKLFTEFGQLDNDYTKRYGGTGLGLALTRKLVELHGGTVRAVSEAGKGSRFIFTMPAGRR